MEFELLGQKIVISDPGEFESAETAIKLVNGKIEELQSTHPTLAQAQLNLLAMLEIAGQLVKERKLINDYRSELDRKCTAALSELSRQGQKYG